MGDGNTDKGEYSTKGIKAANEIVINNGTVNVKSYDDAIHANNDTSLENGKDALGNVTIKGGSVTVYSNDDGLHADGALTVKGGTVTVTNAYEGIEGTTVDISGGYVSVISKDDGINATTTSGTAVSVSGGTLYIYCSGDGIDSNSRTSYQGIVFSGGRTVVITNSGGNSAIDSEQGYKYSGGYVVAIMPRGGMSSEATHCQNFSSVGKYDTVSVSSGSYLVVGIDGDTATIKIPTSFSAMVVVLGDTSPSFKTASDTSVALDSNGVNWN
ncbi:MAG: carbohydrate-binding domain-containing protein [Ruminococcaceae bacterium]|nr:carbohydrate-binding domain-containing protein [Oscillospiraceae bacterium]